MRLSDRRDSASAGTRDGRSMARALPFPVRSSTTSESTSKGTEHSPMEHIRPQGRPYQAGDNGLDRSCGFALPDGSSDAYNEEAFQYFLEIERKRSEMSNRPFLLMLIEFSRQPVGILPDIDTGTARKLFEVLRSCL